MSHSLFISDLHLCSTRPAVTAAFIEFLKNEASFADQLYILGDLFEYWAGDDDITDPHHQDVVQALKHVRDRGTRTFFMHGNRDFLLGTSFAQQSGIALMQDPAQLELHGWKVLLSHGDALCMDDIEYQKFRQQVRDENWQKAFLGQPLSARKAQIEALRTRSESEKSAKEASIMDVNNAAVEEIIRQYDYPQLLIHGHTHRPACHALLIDGHSCERWVLGDWYDQGSCLRLDASGCTTQGIPIP
ncbi:MAG TPA: UDP-2,3-diacylglucosamine diphosphatase [Methylophilaceae bacterium]|nr:UDP-2,3-diacylglucosamine diphosphatase [Methylophilaceae bacterium]